MFPDNGSDESTCQPQGDILSGRTALSSLRQLESLVEMSRLSSVNTQTRESLATALDNVVDTTQDFTDSAYTSHDHRQNIIALTDQVKVQLNQLLQLSQTLVSFTYLPFKFKLRYSFPSFQWKD